MEDSTNPRTQAIAALAELFFESACRSADLAQLESSAIDIGHGCMAEALRSRRWMRACLRKRRKGSPSTTFARARLPQKSGMWAFL